MLTDKLLEKFYKGEVVFHTPTQEIFDKTAEAVRQRGYAQLPWYVFQVSKGDTVIFYNGNEVAYSGAFRYRCSSYGTNCITLSLEDFSEPSEITSVSVITSPGTAVSYTKAKVTKDNNGYTIEVIREPKFTIGDMVVRMNYFGKVCRCYCAPDGRYTYVITRVDGNNEEIPEALLRKLSDVLEEFK